VIILKGTKLRSENINPREYIDEIKLWKGKVEKGEGKWEVINDLERLDQIIKE